MLIQKEKPKSSEICGTFQLVEELLLEILWNNLQQENLKKNLVMIMIFLLIDQFNTP